MAELDLESIRHALQTAKDRGCQRVDVSLNGVRFRGAFAPAPPAPAESSSNGAAPAQPEPPTVKAPVVGILRHREGGLSEGDEIEAGGVIGEITALGLANDIICKEGGVVAEVLADDGLAVEYGAPIVRLKQ